MRARTKWQRQATRQILDSMIEEGFLELYPGFKTRTKILFESQHRVREQVEEQVEDQVRDQVRDQGKQSS